MPLTTFLKDLPEAPNAKSRNGLTRDAIKADRCFSQIPHKTLVFSEVQRFVSGVNLTAYGTEG